MTCFSVFWNSSLHGNNPPKEVGAFYIEENGFCSKVFQNGYGYHAEDGVMESIQRYLPNHDGSKLSITVYQSLSPCQRCSSRYLQLLDQACQSRVTLKLTIVFAGFYKVLRPSCQLNGCTHNVFTQKHRQQLQGLKELRDCGVELRCFEFEDWEVVARHLKERKLSKEEYEASTRAKEDANMKRDLRKLGLQTETSLEDAVMKIMTDLERLEITVKELIRKMTPPSDVPAV